MTDRGMRSIESRQNARVKELRTGLRHGGKTKNGLIAIEGEHLLREAARSRLRIHAIFLDRESGRVLDAGLSGGAEILLLESSVFRSVCATENPQGVAALVEPPRFSLESIFERSASGAAPLLLLEGIQDPGNLGTLVRSAEAFEASGVLLLPGTVSLWNGKALRASAGSAFRLPVLAVRAEEALEGVRGHGLRLLAAAPRGGTEPADLSGPIAMVLGNEGAGLSDWWLENADERITIPCPGRVESLNAAVAGSVLLYEAARQRSRSFAGRNAEADSLRE